MEDSLLGKYYSEDNKAQFANTILTDVIEVIETDPDFVDIALRSSMFNGGGEITAPQQPTSTAQLIHQLRRQAQVRIIEQPASKALRFRYECEGRSAGSIPGVSSTSDNKTFPTIQIVGYKGQAVVVVSCVTKDPPYRPHPHNLVGREGCKKGVCTLHIPTDTMTVQFSNLGIQCVKKKDIEQALKVREEIRVDPFRTGFGHRNQPTTIDLNAVRLCFQVFLEGITPGKCSIPLTPVVSDPIYDKKAMSDLSIFKLSHCTSPVDGGKADMILLCEKVAKEDIQVRFYEENGDWEAFADFQPTQVYKQHAIWFKTPKYKTVDITDPVKVFIQLKRPSDGATSEPLPFELLPLDQGRRPFWSCKDKIGKKDSYSFFNSLLMNESKLFANQNLVSTLAKNESVQTEPLKIPSQIESFCPVVPEVATVTSEINDKNNPNNSLKSNDNIQLDIPNETIEQVDELDEIYCQNQTQLLTNMLNVEEKLQVTENNEVFDDSKTYSSLQLAFKNPVDISNRKYEDIVTGSSQSLIPKNMNKRENGTEKPPLPPKRTKKIETMIGGDSLTNINQPQKSENYISRSYTDIGTVRGSRCSLNISERQSSQPPVKIEPNFSTLPNPKKKNNFFSNLFRKKDKTIAKKSEDTNVSLLGSSRSLTKSAGNVSTVSSNSIHIPLKTSDSITDNTENIDILQQSKMIADNNYIKNDDFDINLDVTEAEHYALYTSVAPYATQSEFDEMSCYYAPVENTK